MGGDVSGRRASPRVEAGETRVPTDRPAGLRGAGPGAAARAWVDPPTDHEGTDCLIAATFDHGTR